MKTTFLVLLISICTFANRNAFLPITKIHVESTAKDSVIFDLNFDKSYRAEKASIYAFNHRYSLSNEELQVFEKLPVINYCVFETGRTSISPELSPEVKSCIKDPNHCSSLKYKEPLSEKVLYIKCGKGNEDAIYMQFDSNGKFEIEF